MTDQPERALSPEGQAVVDYLNSVTRPLALCECFRPFTAPGAAPVTNRPGHLCYESGDFGRWFDALTEDQQAQLLVKAAWEHMTLSAVAREWGVDA